jgi:hypothetical protein
LDGRGYIRVNERLETTAPDVWAMGESGVEHRSDQVIMAAPHAHHRHDPEPAELRLDRFDANSAVLGIEQYKIGLRFGQYRH